MTSVAEKMTGIGGMCPNGCILILQGIDGQVVGNFMKMEAPPSSKFVSNDGQKHLGGDRSNHPAIRPPSLRNGVTRRGLRLGGLDGGQSPR